MERLIQTLFCISIGQELAKKINDSSQINYVDSTRISDYRKYKVGGGNQHNTTLGLFGDFVYFII